MWRGGGGGGGGGGGCSETDDASPWTTPLCFQPLSRVSVGVASPLSSSSGRLLAWDHQLGRRWSSHGSLDRGLKYGSRNADLHVLPCSPAAGRDQNRRPRGLRTSRSFSSAVSSPVRHAGLDVTLAAGGGRVSDLSIQMWLDGQMCGTGAAGKQVRTLTPPPVSSVVKAKEWLLGQKELEIDRQKQEILQLYTRIRRNEEVTQQVLQSQRGRLDERITQATAELPRWPGCGGELGRKLVAAEQEVVQLNALLKQVTQKYTEESRRMEDKIKTRNCYISTLQKKYHRESEQRNGKQHRVETLEKYLSDLTPPDEVPAQAQQQEEARQKAQDLEKTVRRLQKSLDEGQALIKERDVEIETQARRETELIASVHSLQQQVQQCLDDGVRSPMQDLKEFEMENCRLLQEQDHSSRMIQSHKEQIERLTLQLMEPQPLAHVEVPEVGQLLREMSLCLLDLQALCSILAQRAQGEEPSVSLLLGMKSLGVSAEENDGGAAVREELRFKLLEVGQLRRDIDELRKSMSGWRLFTRGTAACPSDSGQH